MQNKKYAEKGLNKAKLDYLLDRINNLEQTLSPKYSVDHSNQSQEEGSSGAAPAAAKAGLKTIPTAWGISWITENSIPTLFHCTHILTVVLWVMVNPF